jgi:hypothetical protein
MANIDHFNKLMEQFKKHGMQTVDAPEIYEDEISFSVEGARGSVAFYRLWGLGWVNIWLGKIDSDSGGLSLQGDVNCPMDNVLSLCKRFMLSGRRKVLRRFERKGYR